jgi:hypothetical protein
MGADGSLYVRRSDQMSGDREQRKLPPAKAGAGKLGRVGFTFFHGAKRR